MWGQYKFDKRIYIKYYLLFILINKGGNGVISAAELSVIRNRGSQYKLYSYNTIISLFYQISSNLINSPFYFPKI